MPGVSARGSCSVKSIFYPRFLFQFFVFDFWTNSLCVGFSRMPLSQWQWLCFRGFDGRFVFLIPFEVWPSYDFRLWQLFWVVAKIFSFRYWVSLSWRLRVGSFNILPECEGALELLTALFFGTYRVFFFRFLASGMFRFDFFERGCWAGRSLGCSSNSSVGCSIGRVCVSGFSSDVR